MIVWINGAFGGGKTQTAHELRRRIGRGWISDPELPGFGLHRMMPRALRRNFQDEPAWRLGVRDVLARLDDHPELSPVIVPMTLVRDDCFDEIVGALRAQGRRVEHFSLIASPETIRRRLRSRVHDAWALAQVDGCVRALASERYATHVDADARSIDAVVEEIAARAGLPLVRPRGGRLASRLRRLGVTLRHVRIG